MTIAIFDDRPLTEAAMATKASCERLKHIIEEYWLGQGAVVHVEVIESGFNASMRCRNYVLSSDMKNGLPTEKNQTRACVVLSTVVKSAA